MSQYFKSLREPDDTIEAPGVIERQVELGDLTVGRQRMEPGWRWSTHIRPLVGGEWCQARHVGVVVCGRLGIRLRDGTDVRSRSVVVGGGNSAGQAAVHLARYAARVTVVVRAETSPSATCVQGR